MKEVTNIEKEKKKNIRSGSYMNMINCNNIFQTDSYYSPVSTNTNINTLTNLTNNNFSIGGNTIKETDDFKLSGNQILQNIFPHKKSSDKMQKLKSSPMITGGVFSNMNFNLKLNSNGHNYHHEHIEYDCENNNQEVINSIKNTKKEIENINEGITFKYNNGYKYYYLLIIFYDIAIIYII